MKSILIKICVGFIIIAKNLNQNGKCSSLPQSALVHLFLNMKQSNILNMQGHTQFVCINIHYLDQLNSQELRILHELFCNLYFPI